MPTADLPHGDSPDEPQQPLEPPPSHASAGSSSAGIASPDADTARWRLIARGLVGLEALAPLVFAVYGLLQLLGGGSVVKRNETMLVVLLAVAGLALLYVAYALGQGRRAVRTASLVWQLLLVLALVPAMWQAGQQLLALLVLALGLVAGYATVRATSEPREDD